jgi:hypothetical protein
MDEVKRGPGRPPKVQPDVGKVDVGKVEGDTYPPVRDPHSLDVRSDAPEVTVTKPKNVEVTVEPVRMVEVELTRKYAPGGQKVEIQKTVPPGTVMELPVHEATRALKLEIARATDNTFTDDKSKK